MERGLDYASNRPNLDEVKRAGFTFVARYVCALVGTKIITKVEAGAIKAHGLGLVLVYEQYIERPLEGRIAGSKDAIVALAQSIAAGFPSDRPIYFAVDFDARPAHQAAIDEYLRGAAEILGIARVGVYGGINLIDRCWASKTATWFWQTGAWSYGKESVHANFVQMTALNGTIVGGVKVDINETRKDDWGAAFMTAVAPLSVGMKWAIDQGIFDKGTLPTRPLDANFLAWSLYRSRKKLG